MPRWSIHRLLPVHSDERRDIVEWCDPGLVPPMKRISTFRCRSGARIGGHYHERQIEIYFIVEGRGHILLVDTESREHLSAPVGPDTRIIIPPLVAHELRFASPMLVNISSSAAYGATDDYAFDCAAQLPLLAGR
jgi:oxalate decarboxylase/phosphoglucose isomerase-like protein (cupin superfamily)